MPILPPGEDGTETITVTAAPSCADNTGANGGLNVQANCSNLSATVYVTVYRADDATVAVAEGWAELQNSFFKISFTGLADGLYRVKAES